MKLDESVQGVPLSVQRSQRGDNVRALTSGKAGLVLPLAYHPILREDAINGQVAVSVQMKESLHPLINAVNVKVYAHLVPFSAFERFSGMDEFNKSYAGTADTDFFAVDTYDRDSEFWKTLGIHEVQGEEVNSAPLEAYNTLINWRRSVRSKHLPERALNKKDLGRAFWSHPILHEIVPDYEEALIDGEIPMSFIKDKIPLHSLKHAGNSSNDRFPSGGRSTAGNPLSGADGDYIWGDDETNQIWSELSDAGVTLSLSNIERAKETVAFAEMRQKYQGIPEEHLIDLLMDAIRIPPEALRQPILLGQASGVIGLSERYATDGENLDMSRTTGSAALSMNLRTPAVNTGGIILITAEITPEPLFERMGDKFLRTTDPETLPQFLRDYLDPKKVEIVDNRFVDVLHSEPDGLFGYRGLNRGWDRDFTLAGGKFQRPIGDAFVEDRQRFWVVESADPSLTEDFYLVSKDLPYTPFAFQNSDPFEILTVSHQRITGNTVFGRQLHEDSGDYQAIVDRTGQEETQE